MEIIGFVILLMLAMALAFRLDGLGAHTTEVMGQELREKEDRLMQERRSSPCASCGGIAVEPSKYACYGYGGNATSLYQCTHCGVLHGVEQSFSSRYATTKYTLARDIDLAEIKKVLERVSRGGVECMSAEPRLHHELVAVLELDDVKNLRIDDLSCDLFVGGGDHRWIPLKLKGVGEEGEEGEIAHPRLPRGGEMDKGRKEFVEMLVERHQKREAEGERLREIQAKENDRLNVEQAKMIVSALAETGVPSQEVQTNGYWFRFPYEGVSVCFVNQTTRLCGSVERVERLSRGEQGMDGTDRMRHRRPSGSHRRANEFIFNYSGAPVSAIGQVLAFAAARARLLQ